MPYVLNKHRRVSQVHRRLLTGTCLMMEMVRNCKRRSWRTRAWLLMSQAPPLLQPPNRIDQSCA
jgi:hypothetical protein